MTRDTESCWPQAACGQLERRFAAVERALEAARRSADIRALRAAVDELGHEVYRLQVEVFSLLRRDAQARQQ